MYRRILVVFDRGRRARAALAEAMRIASNAHADLRLIHVIDDPLVASEGDPFSGTPDEAIARIMLAGADVLREGRALVAAHGLACESQLRDSVEGSLERIVVHDAMAWRADLVVIGSDEASAPRRNARIEQRLRTLSIPLRVVEAA